VYSNSFGGSLARSDYDEEGVRCIAETDKRVGILWLLKA